MLVQNHSQKESVMSLNQLIDEILEKYHQKHRDDLKVLIPLAKKVESVHGDHKDVPKGLGDFLEHISHELENHMQKEEQILFPMIKKGQGPMAQGPIQVMMHEHVGHEESLVKMKAFAHNYILPDDACGSWTALYRGVETLEKELKEHIATENNILFPQSING
jgi:regulator of cell morphogenesis and NO signaling